MNNYELPKWLPKEKQNDYNYILSSLEDITSRVDFNLNEWLQWYNSNDLNNLFPKAYIDLDYKYKLIIIR